jgi:hypothetical protein
MVQLQNKLTVCAALLAALFIGGFIGAEYQRQRDDYFEGQREQAESQEWLIKNGYGGDGQLAKKVVSSPPPRGRH